MTEKQKKIFEGLKAIRPEIAQFYIDGNEILKSNLKSKSNIIGHLLREIESGLRDIFVLNNKDEIEKNISPDVSKLFEELKDEYKEYDYLKDITKGDFKGAKHIASILSSFDLSFNSKLAKQYIKLTVFLHKYAHRSDNYSAPRSSNDIERIWLEFEEILLQLIGNYYSMTSRIDHLISTESPTKEILRALPSILNETSRKVYLFSNLKSVGWLKSLYEENYFDGKYNPEPIPSIDDPNFYWVPNWPVLSYLELVSHANFESPTEKNTEILVSIINNIILYRKQDGERIENYKTDFSIFTMICNLPDNQISSVHLDFIESTFDNKWKGLICYNFDKLIDRLLSIENNDLLLKSISILLKYRIDDSNPFEKVVSVFGEYELKRIIEEQKEVLIDKLGEKLLDHCLKTIRDIVNISILSFDSLTVPTIEEHSQNKFPDKYECQLVFLVRDCFEKLPLEQIRGKLINMLNEEHPIFKRIALHVINQRYSECSDIFWNWRVNPLDIPLIKHELYELLKRNSKNFDKEQIELVLNWIEATKYYSIEDFNGDEEKMIEVNAYYKKEWVSSLLETGYEEVLKKYDQLNLINNSDVEHPGFDAWFSVSYGTTSPLSQEDIEKKSIEELIVFANKYIEEKHDFMGDSAEGLATAISSSVPTNLIKYVTNCDSLTTAPSIILYAWINGLSEAIKNPEIPSLNNVFSTINIIVSKDNFWEVHNSDNLYSKLFVSSLLRFIESVLKNDSIKLTDNDLNLIKTILFEILQKNNSEVIDNQNLPLTVLNNTKGKNFICLIEYSLRKARMEDKEEDYFDSDIKDMISVEISSGSGNSLMYCVLGQYLSDILYLDSHWLKEHYSLMFSKDNPLNWHAIITGYLYFHFKPHESLFELLLKNGDYELAIIQVNSFDKQVINNLTIHLCIAYLRGLEKITIDSSLLQGLISSNNSSIISSYIHLFWSPQALIPTCFSEKIKDFWRCLFNQSKELKNPEHDKLRLSGSCKWLKNFIEIDEEIYSWLMFSAPYISQMDKHFVFEYLEQHINNSPEKVGNILINIFQHGVQEDISRGKITSMVNILYKKGLKGDADKICNIHGEKGIDFLRDVFNQNIG